MIRILSSQQIRQLDAATIEREPIESIDLMERACQAFVTWFTERYDASKKIGIVCGTGNNGGDGLGIARLLREWNYPVKVWIVQGSTAQSDDFRTNLGRLRGKAEILEISTDADRGLFYDRDILIDALFGSGLSRAAEGIYAQLIQCINQTPAVRIAVDIPSGLMADKSSEGLIVTAHHTVSFQLPKLAFFFPSHHPYVGNWHVVDIGLNKDFIKQSAVSHFYVTRKDIRKMINKRSAFDHKGTFGHALMVAGSTGKIGAAVLASRAVLRAGAGLLTIHIPRSGYTILQSSVPEAMASVDKHEDHLSVIPSLAGYSAIGIGPGIGMAPETVKAVGDLLTAFGKPVVIDADALNILSAHRELLLLIPPGSILTPHPKEFERLVGAWKNDFERLEKQKSLAQKLKCVVLLKGAFTSIVLPDARVYFNSTGNPGMATGGSGDVLTGILTALLAQGYEAHQAALIGTYLHGLAGDLAAYDKGMTSLIASDLIDYLPASFKTVS